jgi:hypothetical protein
VKRFLRRGDPVISVDTKKKELVGAFKNAGRTWRPRGQPIEVHVQDFPHLGQGKAIPYGAYDIARDRAVVHVGITHDTAEFAVESMRHWWKLDGHRAYQGARQLLICADAGGSHGSRPRAWKVQLQRLANPIGMSITVCHYPPGTSKWNQIEHRLFSFISLNWKGRPLLNYETVVNLIGATRTRSGLQVKALLDTNQYEIGNEVSTAEFKQVNLRKQGASGLELHDLASCGFLTTSFHMFILLCYRALVYTFSLPLPRFETRVTWPFRPFRQRKPPSK